MISPQNDSYTCPANGRVSAGRYLISGDYRVSVWGQSNALARAQRTDISAAPLSADAGLAVFDAGTFDRVYIWRSGAYVKMTPSVYNGSEAGQFGPEFGLAVRWMRETSSGRLFIDKEASAGSPITYWEGGTYANMLTRRGIYDSWLSSQGISPVNIGWLWIQGESDYQQTQSYYQTKLENLIAANLSNGIILPTTKRILTQMRPSTTYYSANVAAAKNAIVASAPSLTIAPVMPNHYNVDGYHLNGQGIIQVAYDAFEYFFGASHLEA